MRYKLCIEGDSGKINITDPDVIKKINIRISQQLFGDLGIQGLLNDKSQQETKEIFEWSMKTDKASVYKAVSIQVYNQEELLRDYYLEDMYCTSYEENFDEYQDGSGSGADSIGSFVLKMKQKEGSIGTIVVSYE